MRRLLVVACVCLMSASFAPAQKPAAPAAAPLSGAIASHPDWPKAKPADVDSVDHILAALYDVISGPANQARDWVRFRSLFVPDARLIPVRAAKDSADVIFLSVDGYIARASAVMESEGFYEHGTHNQIEQFNDIVHIFSTYESRHAVGDAKPFARGINSIQLVKDGARYWIVDVFWDAERPDAPIPPKYLPTTGSDATHLNQNLTGEWVGQLEYRDFQSNERVFLPAWLTMTPSADGRAVQLAYVYDDGPTKTVRETSMLTLLPEAKRATLGSEAEADTYAVAGLEEFAKLNRGTLVLTGPGKENDKPVDVRITLTLRRNLFTLVKETKPAGEDFKFRDGYTFTRASAPSQ